ncbi:MAG TPA: hypothetical protein VMZ30_10595, partial [Pyrinomonadaceae bacterium]|nr:hypothetical protein [Pyrinomonadaceae bacterium]
SRLAKSGEKSTTLRYFVEEQMIAAPLLVLALVVMALVGAGDVMMGFRVGLTTFLASPAAPYAALVGLFYAALCICTTLIFLDRRENTFCMPMHCGSSMLAGFTASAALAYFFNQRSLSMAQTVSAGLIVVALGFLSPLHHFQRTQDKLSLFLARAFEILANIARGRRSPISPEVGNPVTAENYLTAAQDKTQQLRKPPRIFLFVCSGNTCRSPMAAAISNLEIATRLNIPFTVLETVNVQALSAGLTASVGAPMTAEATNVLRSLNVPVGRHAARNLTVELAEQAERIFCMTSAHRQAVIEMIPSVAWKTYCLDHEGDIGDPIGKGMEAYLNCALRVRTLIRQRFDQLGLEGAIPE